MVSGPFLFPLHTAPIPSFWSEWLASALGLAGAVAGLLFARRQSLKLPPTLGIPAVLLLTLLLQYLLGSLFFPQIGLLTASYLLWAGLLMILGRHLADTIGFGRLADVLAGALVFGAMVGAGIAFAQWMEISAYAPWIFPSDGRIYANIGQANHHVHYSWLGIASAFYLRGRGCLSRSFLWLSIIPIAFFSILGGSRSALLYPVILLSVIAWAKRKEPGGSLASLQADAALLLPAVIVLNFLGPVAGSGSAFRLYDSVSGPSERLAVARAGWSAFLEHPWLGQGAGNYPWASFLAAASRTGEEPVRVAEHAHNFILHGLAEFGAPATCAVILLLILWVKNFVRQPWGLEQFWCAAVLGIGVAHSLLEYPLWYTFFLGPTALLLGASDGGKTIILAGRRIVFYLVIAAFGGAWVLARLSIDYAAIEAASFHPLAAHADREQAWRITLDRLKELQRESLLSPWALLAFAELAEPSRLQAKERAVLCEQGIRFSPTSSLLTRCAMQLAIAEREADAVKLTLAVLRAHPQAKKSITTALAKGAQTFPEVRPLWVLSEQP